MAEIKKVQIRFNLDDDVDSTLWNHIQQQVRQKKGNSYLKNLILLGLTRKEQKSLLDEIQEIKQILTGSKKELSFLGKEEEKITEKPTESEVLEEKIGEIPQEAPEDVVETKKEEPFLDEKVANFLDSL